MATYRSRTHVSLGERLADAAIGGVIGTVLGVVAAAVTVWLRIR